MRIGTSLLAAVLIVLAVAPARAEEPPPMLQLSDAELAARLDFLERRLDAARPASLAWQWGWTGFYGASLVLSGGYAAVAEDGDDRVRAVVAAHDREGFGHCTNINECEAACPKEISVEHIAQLNRDYVGSTLAVAVK